MDNPNPIYYRDLITPDDSITKLISQLEELTTKYESLKSKTQGAAEQVKQSMQGVSGATEEQRKTIQLATEQSDKLLKAYQEYDSELLRTKKAQAELNAANREATQIAKLLEQINHSAEGSYNRLSAQYRLNKIALDAMSAEQRKGTEAGRQLEAETEALYQEMKRLQEATGMHQLNVGNYADAAKGLKEELRSLTSQMAYLKTQGQTNSEEYQNMAQRAGVLKDALMDANSEVKAMASDTQTLDTVMGAATAVSGGFSAYTGALNLLGVNSQSAADAQKTLGGAIALVSGATAIQNALQKESNLMTGIRVLQSKAAAKAEALDAAAKKANTAATGKATIAQKLFNAVAAANPYVLLAIALVTVVGALVAFTAGANKAAKEQKKLNDLMTAYLDALDAYAQGFARASNDRIEKLQAESDVAKAQGKSLKETAAIEDKIYEERVKAHEQNKIIYGDQIANLNANIAKLNELQKTLYEIQQAQAQGKNYVMVDVDLDGTLERTKIDKAITAIQGQIDNYGRQVEIGMTIRQEGRDLEKEREVELANRRKAGADAAKAARKAETDAIRAEEDARIALIQDAYAREKAAMDTASKRQIEDIKTRLKEEKNLTVKARQSLNAQIELIESQHQRDMADLANKYMIAIIQTQRDTEDLRLSLMADGAEKRRKELENSYKRQIEDINNEIATNTSLTEKQVSELYSQLELLGQQYRKAMSDLEKDISLDQLNAQTASLQLRIDAAREGSQEQIDLTIELYQKQREIELAENAKLAEGVRQSEAEINAKWDAKILQDTAKMVKERAMMILEQEQELQAAEFSLLNKNERQKEQFQLAQEKARLQKLLELDEQAGYKMTETERKTIETTIKAIEKEAKKMPYDNLYELLGIGFDSNQQSALNTAINSIKDSISSLVDSWEQAADAAVSAADKQVEAAQKALDAEIAAREAGYANDVATAQKELALAKNTQAQATAEKKKAQKAQAAIDALTQSSSLVTASANIWSALSGIPAVGPALAAAAVITMWASFAAAKVRAAQVTKQEQYAEGTVELLQGGSHASGHDIDLGTKPDGTRRRAEGGEFFAVINKRNSRRFRNEIPAVINALNDGTFADKYQRANAGMSDYAINVGTDVGGIERDVAAIRRQGDEHHYFDGKGREVIVYKNLTRRIQR